MAILGLDFGEKRIGLAISEQNLLARRLTTLKGKNPISQIKEICLKFGVEKIVIGLPKGYKKAGGEAEKIKKFASQLGQNLKIPIIFEDETLTTDEAENLLTEQGFSRQKIKEVVDQEAARIILQDWLNSKNKGQDEC